MNFGVITSILGVSGLELQWHRACYFLLSTILAWGEQFVWRAQAVSWGGTARECPPRRRATKLQQFIEL